MRPGATNPQAILVNTAALASRLLPRLERARSIAVDCEAAGYHRYSDRLCLVQLSTEAETYILDPLAVRLTPYLKPSLEGTRGPVLMHGAAYDLRLLRRDLDIVVTELFDTQIAAEMLGEPRTNLQALLTKFVGVRVSKKYQRADWAQRPLPHDMIEYAASDTEHLHQLAHALMERLDRRGRVRWVLEECRWLTRNVNRDTGEEPARDPVTRVAEARRLDPRAVTTLRNLISWRNNVARNLDRAPFRVVSNAALLGVVLTRPTSLSELAGIPGMPKRLAHTRGQSLLDVVRHADRLPESQLIPYPLARRSKSPLSPTQRETLERAKQARNAAALRAGLDRGRLMANDTLIAVVRREPQSLSDLESLDEVRRWQIELFGQELLSAL